MLWRRFHWMKCLDMRRNCDRPRRERASLRWNIVGTVRLCQKLRNSWYSDGKNSRTNLLRTARRVDIMHGFNVTSMFWRNFLGWFCTDSLLQSYQCQQAWICWLRMTVLPQMHWNAVCEWISESFVNNSKLLVMVVSTVEIYICTGWDKKVSYWF